MTRGRRKAVLAGKSLEHQLDQWMAWRVDCAVPRELANIAIDKLTKQLRKVAPEVPSATWLEQIREPATWPPGRYAAAIPQKYLEGGIMLSLPPSGRLMPRAKGESRLYPLNYLTSSGHSFDVYCQRVYLGASQWLTVNVNGHSTSVRIGECRVESTLAGELMLQIGTVPTPLEDIIGKGDGQIDVDLDRAQRAIQQLSRAFGVRYIDNYVWVPSERWAEFNAAATEYDRRPQGAEGDRMDVSVDGYMGSVTRIGDLCPELRRLVRKGIGFQNTRRK